MWQFIINIKSLHSTLFSLFLLFFNYSSQNGEEECYKDISHEKYIIHPALINVQYYLPNYGDLFIYF